jgi:prepilin-type N-terminal cleavage/methylation domain-containing protein
MCEARGMSLLEVLVVLALIAILGGMSVLSHQAMRPALDLRIAARQVVMDLRAARMRAVAENVIHRVVFPSGAVSYQPQRKSGSGYVNDGTAVPLPRGILISECNATDHGISFKPRGNAATFGTVVIRNGNGDERRIIVDIAGQVRVQ